MKRMACCLLMLLLALLCASALGEGSSLYVKKVENLPEDFILGMDASSIIAEEKSGVRYYGFDGQEQDVLKTMAESGINTIRVRVWNHPYDQDGHGYGGGNCDIDTALAIGRRAAQYGMGLLVDFHYSDFWADPAKQMAPLAWKGMEIEDKTQAAYEYTRDCLLQLKEAGVKVSMVQLGNETNGALAGEKTWFNIQYIMQAGAKATREVYPEALVALHFTNPEKAESYETYAKKMAYYNVDYDVFASSYYPYWHGTLDNLAQVLSGIAQTYGKKVMVMETSYAYTGEDSDFFGNTIGEGGGIVKDYPFTVQGQANSVRNIIDTMVNRTENGIGVVYWEGAWISVGGSSWEENSALWDAYGSGWATQYAWAYDPKDAGKYYGGNAVDNQAMFDPSGHPLESLRVFSLVREGNETAPAADALEDVNLICDINGAIALPETVNAVMTDNSLRSLPVVWHMTEEMDKQMHEGGVAKYVVTGEAGGMEARAYVSMVEFNFLRDYSFEEGGKGWELTDLKKASELYVENKVSDSLTGRYHVHFWSAVQDSVEFTLEQQVQDLPEGKYKYSISIMGGDCGTTDIYAYVKINGEIVEACPMAIRGYNNWDTALIPCFAYDGQADIRVGVYVKCQGQGKGAWGKIDDALLNSVK